MALSDELTKLATQTRSLEESAAAVRAKDHTALQDRQQQVSAELDAASARINDAADSARSGIEDGWTELKRSVSDRMAELRQQKANRKAERQAAKAEHAADDADEYAAD